jgi:hypothetical protein
MASVELPAVKKRFESHRRRRTVVKYARDVARIPLWVGSEIRCR